MSFSGVGNLGMGQMGIGPSGVVDLTIHHVCMGQTNIESCRLVMCPVDTLLFWSNVSD